MTKHRKKIRTPSALLFLTFLFMGFGLGYTTKEFTQSPTNPVPHPSATPQILGQESVSVCFTPNKQCQANILREISKATKSIYVQAYSFTDKEIAEALGKAASRGVDVKVLLDKSNRKDDRSAKNILFHYGIPLRFDAPNGIAHNKIMIIDEATIISGSYNFSQAAYKRNTENLLVIYHPTLASTYLQNWQDRWKVSN